MTVQYEGNNTHKIIFGRKEVLLTEDEVDEIQCWNFAQGIETKTVSDLEQMIDEIQEEVLDLARDLANTISNLDKLFAEDELNDDEFDKQRDNISEIIIKLQRI